MIVAGESNSFAALQWDQGAGFTVESADTKVLRAADGVIHARRVHGSFYDSQGMRISETGIRYLLPIFTDAIDAGDADTGQVEIYVDKRGEVQLQQMRRWPTKRGLSITRLAALSSFVVAVAVPAGLGLYYFTQHTL